ncbi:MAG: diguanylate cyclase, partial [Nitrospinae bacterium]|nr:diguanylate cyclase [Nitrospinota bacterium]
VDEAHRITLFNQGAEKLFGYLAEEVIGKPLDILLPKRISEADHSRMYDGAASPFRSLGMGERGAFIGRRKDDTEFPVEASVSMLELGGEKVFTAILRDVSKRQEMERKLEVLATTDALTKLYNRAYFTSKLEEEFQRAERYNAHLSLMLIDIDHFKSVNDTYGHQAGDAYLEAIAGLVASSVRQVDTVARYGGEELAVILPSTNLSEAMVLADRLRERVEAFDVSCGGHAIRRTISIGVASLTEGSAKSTDEFLTAADRALYMAKRGGRNLVVLYRDGMGRTFSKLTI